MQLKASEDDCKTIQSMEDANAGMLFKLLCFSVVYGNPHIYDDTPADVKVAFNILSASIARSDEISKARAEAGRQGGLAKASKTVANPSKPWQILANSSKTGVNIYPIYSSKTEITESTTSTEDSTRVLNTTSPKASDGSNPVSTDKEVLDKWMEYIVRRHNIGKELTHEEASKAWAILLEKSNGDPAKAKSILQKSIDRIRTEPKKEPKPKNRTNNFFDFNERKPGDPDYKDLDAIARKEI